MIRKLLCLIFGHKWAVEWIDSKLKTHGIGTCIRCGEKAKP